MEVHDNTYMPNAATNASYAYENRSKDVQNSLRRPVASFNGFLHILPCLEEKSKTNNSLAQPS